MASAMAAEGGLPSSAYLVGWEDGHRAGETDYVVQPTRVCDGTCTRIAVLHMI